MRCEITRVAPALWIVLQGAAEGNLDAAKALVPSSPARAQGRIAAFVATTIYAPWLLEPRMQDSAVAFLRVNDSRDRYLLVAAMVAFLRGDLGRARILADSAAAIARVLSAELPRVDAHRVTLAFAAAMSGRADEARAQSDSALAIHSTANDAFEGPLHELLFAEIAATIGDRDRALRFIRPLLPPTRGLLTAGWLRIDPWFAPLRDDPEFKQLAGIAKRRAARGR